MARTLYREWFVHFRFPGHEKVPLVASSLGEIPRGWEVTTLRQVTTKIGSGATPRGGKDAYKSEGIHLIRSLNIYDYSFEFADLAFIDDRQAAELDNVIVEENDILLNITGASVARCALMLSYLLPARVNQHVAIVRADPTKASPFYILGAINSDQRKQQLLALAQGGATREALTKDTVSNFEIVLPPRPLMKRYDDIARGVHKQRESLMRKVQNLRRTRDLLLPRLLSGQVPLNIDAAEQQLAEAQAEQLQPISAPVGHIPTTRQPANEPSQLKVAEAAPPTYAADKPPDINDTERTDVLCAVRALFSDGVARDRSTAIRDLSHALGYQRTGSRIQEVLATDLLTAVRRGIVVNDGGLYSLGFRTLTDCTRESLKNDFESAIGRGWIHRDDAVRAFARWLGFARVGKVIDDTARSLINGLIREDRLETDGPELIRIRRG